MAISPATPSPCCAMIPAPRPCGRTRRIWLRPLSSPLPASSSTTPPVTQITAGRGSSVLLQMLGDTVAISAASPDHWNGTMSYRINRQLTGANATWDAAAGYTTINFELPGGSDAGSTVTQRFYPRARAGSNGSDAAFGSRAAAPIALDRCAVARSKVANRSRMSQYAFRDETPRRCCPMFAIE